MNIGKRFNIIDIVVPLSTLTWLVMPVVTYNIFNESDSLAKLWDTYMKISSERYFTYALPATILFVLGLKIPFKEPNFHHKEYIDSLKSEMNGKSRVSLLFLLIGIIATLLVRITPEIFRNIVFNFSYLTFVGMFYAIFSNFKQKSLIISVCVFLLIAQVIVSGMYGPLIYIGIMTFLVISVAKGIGLKFKILGLAIGIFGIFLIQSIKGEYREAVWDGLNRGSDPVVFASIVVKKILNPVELFEPIRLFGMTVRANQGLIVADAMNYVPKNEPFAGGETITLAVISSFIPRFLWPSKPKAGGAENVCRFLGDCTSSKLGVSYNLGPIGEAYVNFGVLGGIIFMFFYGMFMKFCFVKVLRLSINFPTLLLWIPLLFIPVFSMENDVLSFVNSFLKSAFFCFVCYKGFYILFRIRI